jgi:hypothetical protein
VFRRIERTLDRKEAEIEQKLNRIRRRSSRKWRAEYAAVMITEGEESETSSEVPIERILAVAILGRVWVYSSSI